MPGCFLISSGLYFGFDAVLSKSLHAEPGPTREMLSVVAQQLGRIHTYIDDEDTNNQIDNYLDFSRTHYIPSVADETKPYFTEKGIKHMDELLGLSWKLFRKYPLVSIDSFLFTTKGFWHIGDTSFSWLYGTGIRLGGYMQTQVFNGYGIFADSKIPWLEQILERLFSDNEFAKIPVLSILLSPALYSFIFLFVFLCLGSMRSKYVMCCIYFIFLGLTILFGPYILVGYVYPFMISAPVLVWLLNWQIGYEMRDDASKRLN